MNNIEYIETVKIQGEGYLVNGSLSVPKAEGNRHYEDLKVWLESNTPEPEDIIEPTYSELRAEEYGTIIEQIEFITENGLKAWQTKVAEIKEKYPKA